MTDETQTGSPPQLSAPKGYEGLQEIGRGGMGIVYKAWHVHLKRWVALKMIRASGFAGAEELVRFRREAEAVAQMQHPNIVQVYEVGEHNGLPYIALEYVDGGSLAQQLTGGPLTSAQAADVVRTLARAAQAAHERAVIHRDLKPANVLLGSDGAVKITDFGLAKRLSEDVRQTRSGTVLGTPSYMAPEQARGHGPQVGPAADVYALGAILYECLTGHPPFRGASALETLDLVCRRDPVPPSRLTTVPRDLETICLKSLEKDPSRRYASAQALADDLDRFLAGEPIRARPLGFGSRLLKWARRRPTAAALVALSVLTPIAVIGILVERNVHVAAKQEETEKALREKIAAIYVRSIGFAHREAPHDLLRADRLLQECPEELCGWEWHYLSRLCHAELHTYRGHRSLVTRAVFSPDRKHIASTGHDRTVQIWDPSSGQLSQTLEGHPVYVSQIAFCHDGKRLAVATGEKGGRGQVWVWDVTTGKRIHLLGGLSGRVNDVAFNHDGSRLASASSDRTVRLWDADTGQQLGELRQAGNRIAFSPDGRHLATTPEEGLTIIWDIATLKEVSRLDGGGVVAYSPDGKRIATGAKAQYAFELHDVKLWDARAGRLLALCRGHVDHITSLAFSPSGDRLATAGGLLDGTVRVWEVPSGLEMLVLRGIHPKPPFKPVGPVHSVAFSPDGRRLATTGEDRTVKVWDARAGQEGGRVTLRSRPIARFTPDSTRLAFEGPDRSVQVWDLTVGRALPVLPGHPGPPTLAVASADQELLAVATATFNRDWKKQEGILKVWHVGEARKCCTVAGHVGQLRALALSPDDKMVASAGLMDTAIKVSEPRTGRLLAHLQTGDSTVNTVAFCPGGRRLASGHVDGTVKLWDVGTAQHLLTQKAHDADVTEIVFSPDGKRFASISNNNVLKLWNTADGSAVFSLTGHTDHVHAMAFSPDGHRLASGGSDQTVKLWDMTTGEEVLTLRGHKLPVRSLSFSRNGKRLFSLDEGSTLRIWYATPTRGEPEPVPLFPGLAAGSE